MDLKRMGRISGFVAAVAMLAMVLQGCGSDGDGGSGISQDMYDALQADYDEAVADRDVAMAAQMAAMEAQTMAETERDTATAAQMAAMEAQAAAEARRDVAVAAQAVATAAAAAAETAKMGAEDAEAIAVAAQTMAEDERDAARLDVVAAEAAQAIAEAAKTAADAARDAAVTAQMAAEDAQEVAEDAAAAAMAAEMTAKAAEMTAKADLKVAQAAEMAAKAAQATAEAAEMTAKADLKAAQATQKKAEDDLATAIMERDDALAMVTTATDADAAARARVDAASIQRSARDVSTIRLVDVPEATGGAEVHGVSIPVSTTNTVEMFQGSGDIPGDGDLDASNGRSDPGKMKLTATRVGNTVTFTATADGNPADNVPAMVLIDIDDAVAGADGMTSHMEAVDLPGGVTKNIFLVSDIEAATTGTFGGANLPTGLEAATFDDGTQTTRHVIHNNVQFEDGDADTPIADRTSNTSGVINTADNPAIDITLGDAFTPSTATPVVAIQTNAMFSGTYAGVAGYYICNAGVATGCNAYLNGDDELILGGFGEDNANNGIIDGRWAFSPASSTRTTADSDYLIYGAWLKVPDSALGTGASAGISSGSNLFDAHAHDDDDADAGAVNDPGIHLDELAGKASYSGTAAGFFADRRVGVDAAVSGTFTATATLNADFATNADNDAGTISGKISDFVRDDGVETDWALTLGLLDYDAMENTEALADGNDNVDGVPGLTNLGLPSDAAGAFTAGATSGTASGAIWSGEWGVQLVGAGPSPATSEQHPTGVVGTFGAAGGSPEKLATGDAGFVGVIGGFGARKE